MKKIITILLLFIYSVSALGIAVNYHYCQGDLSNVTVLNFGGNGGCECNPSGMPPGCCKDKMLYLKGDDHKSSPVSITFLPGNFAIDLPVLHYTLLLPKEFCIISYLNFDFVRQKSTQSLFLLNNVFRI